MNRLTPWSNDPVVRPARRGGLPARRGDRRGLDADAPAPAGAGAAVTVRHGQGYTLFTTTEPRAGAGAAGAGPARRPGQAGPPDACATPATGPGGSRRRSTPSGCSGPSATARRMQVVCELDAESRRRPRPQRLGGRLRRPASPSPTWRRGRGPSPPTAPSSWAATARRRSPAALGRAGLSGRAGPALDPCAALMTPIDPGPRPDGRGRLRPRAGGHAGASRGDWPRPTPPPAGRRQALAEVAGAVGPRPGGRPGADARPALDLMLNRWLLYQVTGLPVWGRSAFYQSGGAYGFRDQLQDVMALVYGAPDEARAQILRAAAGSSRKATCSTGGTRRPGRGVRTRFSDDLLWLPLRRLPLRHRHRRRRACSTSRCRSSKRPCCGPSRRRTTACPT